MKYEEIIKLLDAGYTREEIMNMKDEPVEPATPEEPEQPVIDMSDTLKEMRDMFAEMRKEITALNIMTARQPADEVRTSEEIIANIINPTQKNGGK